MSSCSQNKGTAAGDTPGGTAGNCLQHMFVDQAVAETLPDRLQTWRQTPFDIFFKGDDWKDTPRGMALETDFAAVGVDVIYFPYTVHTSSTVLRRALEVIDREQVDHARLRRMAR